MTINSFFFFLTLEGLEPASIDVYLYAGMDAELRCPHDTSNGSTTEDGEFMWSVQAENGIWQPVAIRKRSTLQQSFRKQIYDEELGKGTLSNNETINEKFYGRVNISEVGTLIVMNSTVKDSGYFQCKFKGYTDRGLPRESVVHLIVKSLPCKLCLEPSCWRRGWNRQLSIIR